MMIIIQFEMPKMRGHDYHDGCWTVIITVTILVTIVINIIIIIIMVVISISFYTIHFKCGVNTIGDAEDASS